MSLRKRAAKKVKASYSEADTGGSVHAPPPPSTPTTASSGSESTALLSSTVSGTSYFIIFSFLSRVITFILNHVLVRYTSAAAMGFAAVKMDVYCQTTLFLAREGVRTASLSYSLRPDAPPIASEPTHPSAAAATMPPRPSPIRSSIEQQRVQFLVNTGWLTVPLAVLLATATGLLYVHQPPQEVLDAGVYPAYTRAIALYAIACGLECLAEPAFLLLQHGLHHRPRVALETLSLTCRALTSFVLLVVRPRHDDAPLAAAMGAFAWAQVAGAVVLCVGHGLVVRHKTLHARSAEAWAWPVRHLGQCLPRRARPTTQPHATHGGTRAACFLDPDARVLLFALIRQTFFKHFLTMGDALFLSLLSPLQDQGVFAVVMNYGSLVARVLLQPMEETSRTLFGKLWPDACGPHADAKATGALVVLLDYLALLLKFDLYLGLAMTCLAPAYVHLLLSLLLGPRWLATHGARAPTLLAWVCRYVAFLALNGSLEACVTAGCRRPAAVRHRAWAMLATSLLWLVAVAVLTRGTTASPGVALVAANMIGMAARIAYGVWWLHRALAWVAGGRAASTAPSYIAWRQGTFWRGVVVPPMPVWVAFALASQACRLSARYLYTPHAVTLSSAAAHVSVGVVALVAVAGVVYRYDQGFLCGVHGLFRRRGNGDATMVHDKRAE